MTLPEFNGFRQGDVKPNFSKMSTAIPSSCSSYVAPSPATAADVVRVNPSNSCLISTRWLVLLFHNGGERIILTWNPWITV